MGRATTIGRALRDAVDLRTAQAFVDEDLRARLDVVARRRIDDIGASVPKTRAAEILGVSVTALDKWIGRGAVPLVPSSRSNRDEVETHAVVDLAVEMIALREAGQRRGLLATALERRAAQRRKTRPPAMGTRDYLPDQGAEHRRDFTLLTPGERVGQAMRLSRTATKIAAAGARARRTTAGS
jgi:hypothetical protein